MEKVIKIIEKYLLFTVVFLLPIAIIGVSSNPFVIGKLQLLFYGICLYLIVKSVRTLLTGKFELAISNFDIPLLIILITYVLSTMLRTSNKMEALLLPGTTTAVVGGILLYFFINQLESKSKEIVTKVVVFSSSLFSLWILLAYSGLLSSLPITGYLKAKTFTPEAGYLPSAIYLITTLVLTAGVFVAEKNITKKVVTGIAGFLIVCALVVSVYNLLPGKPGQPKFPSLNTSWSIAVDSLKVSPILGIGPANYLTVFSRFRPASYNNTDLWAVKFSTASNFYLNVLTEVGLLGFAGFVVLLYQIFKNSKKEFKETKLVNWGFAPIANFVSLIVLLILFLFYPATNLLVIMFFVILALNTKTKMTKLNLVAENHEAEGLGAKISTNFPALLLTAPILIVVVFMFFKSINIVRAEYLFNKSVEALSKNDVKAVYDIMVKAINLNPRVDRYRASFSRVNLLLANAIVQKKELSDDEKKTLTQLIQVSISEAKANVALNPLRADNWAMLASTYRSVMPLAKGADEFAIQSYRQAIVLDPLNPNLRIALGGVYYARKDYDSAIAVFRTVTEQVKKDLPNAHYNLAFAYKEKGQLDNAINEMTIVLSLLKSNSKDYEVAQKALSDLQTKKKETAPTGEDLTPPQEEKKAIDPKVDLPQGSEPPATPAISVTPTPSATGTPSTSITPQLTPTPTQSQ